MYGHICCGFLLWLWYILRSGYVIAAVVHMDLLLQLYLVQINSNPYLSFTFTLSFFKLLDFIKFIIFKTNYYNLEMLRTIRLHLLKDQISYSLSLNYSLNHFNQNDFLSMSLDPCSWYSFLVIMNYSNVGRLPTILPPNQF